MMVTSVTPGDDSERGKRESAELQLAGSYTFLIVDDCSRTLGSSEDHLLPGIKAGKNWLFPQRHSVPSYRAK